jgi:hypothetical protein
MAKQKPWFVLTKPDHPRALAEGTGEERGHHGWGEAPWRRQAREHGVGFDQGGRWQDQATAGEVALKQPQSWSMLLVPGEETGDHHVGVDSDNRHLSHVHLERTG